MGSCHSQVDGGGSKSCGRWDSSVTGQHRPGRALRGSPKTPAGCFLRASGAGKILNDSSCSAGVGLAAARGSLHRGATRPFSTRLRSCGEVTFIDCGSATVGRGGTKICQKRGVSLTRDRVRSRDDVASSGGPSNEDCGVAGARADRGRAAVSSQGLIARGGFTVAAGEAAGVGSRHSQVSRLGQPEDLLNGGRSAIAETGSTLTGQGGAGCGGPAGFFFRARGAGNAPSAVPDAGSFTSACREVLV